MDSVSATQPTFDLNSFSELRGIIVEVQLFGAKAATTWVVVRRLLHPALYIYFNVFGFRLIFALGVMWFDFENSDEE
jgi:hypothetical protein